MKRLDQQYDKVIIDSKKVIKVENKGYEKNIIF